MNESWQKYVIGIVAAALVTLCAVTMMLRQQAWVPGSRYIPGMRGVSVTGPGAVFMGVACLGVAGYLFARFYLEKAVQGTRGQNVTYLLQVCALVVLVAGVGLAFWFELFV